MNSQLYTATSGLLVEERRVEMITNNLANLSTAGFRARRTFSTVYSGVLEQPDPNFANRAVALAGSYEVPGRGPTQSTGRGLDIALSADDLLAVETPAGRRYTRAGELGVSPDGELTALGRRVLGAGGKPIGGLSPAAAVTPAGRVVDNGEERGSLLIVRDPARTLQIEGGNLFSAGGNDAALETVSDPQVEPGRLESSAADPLGEMIRLIEAQRAFESYQRMISVTMNEVNRKAVNEIAG